MRLLLIDDGWPSALLLAHQLAGQGHRVHRMGTRWLDPILIRGLASQARVPRPESVEFLPTVERELRRTGADLVMPLFESALYRVWGAGPEWQPRVFPRVEPWQLRLLVSKGALTEFVAGLGVAVPGQRWLRRPEDLAEAGGELGYPLVIKGETGLGGDRVRVVGSRMEAEAAFAELRRGRDEGLVAQEFIAGATWMATGLFREGRMLRYYGAEKLALDPPQRGQATSVRSSDDAELAEAATKVFAGLKWTGLAHTDFIRDPAGRLRFLEMNPRPWGSITCAADAGVEVFRSFSDLLLDRAIVPDLRCIPNVVSVVGANRLRSQVRRGTLAGLLAALQDRESWRSLNCFPGWTRVHLRLRMLLIWGANLVRRGRP